MGKNEYWSLTPGLPHPRPLSEREGCLYGGRLTDSEKLPHPRTLSEREGCLCGGRLTDGEKLPHPRPLSEREGCLCADRLTDGKKLSRPITRILLLNANNLSNQFRKTDSQMITHSNLFTTLIGLFFFKSQTLQF